MNRKYQPSLLWAFIANWYKGQDISCGDDYGPHDLTIYIYRTDRPGAYMLTGPKMYWQDEPIIGDHFGVISQSDLSDNADLTGEVIMWDRRLRKTTVVGKTIGDALNRIDQ